jgi:hypothetical protein
MPQMQKTHKFFISRAEADKEEFQVQTDWAFKMDNGTQTPSSNLTDSGIQVDREGNGNGLIRIIL